MVRFALVVVGVLLVSCKEPPPEIPETVLTEEVGFEPLPPQGERERAAGEFEIISAYEYPARLNGQRADHVIAVDLDISNRASIDLGAVELIADRDGSRFSAFRVYRLDENGERVGMRDPTFAGESRFFVAFALPEVPDRIRLEYWGMPLGAEPVEVAESGRVHAEPTTRVVAASHAEPQGWFQAHWLLLEMENASRSARIEAPIGCDGRIGRMIELDGDERRSGLTPRPPIVPLRRVLIDQRCWVSDGFLPPEIAPDVSDIPTNIIAIGSDLPDGATVLENHWGVVRSLAFSRSGERLAVAANGRAIVWDVDAAERLMAVEDDPVIRQVLLSPDGTRLVISAVDHAPTLWDVDTETRVRELLMSGTPSTSSHVRMSPTGQLFGVDSAIGVQRALTIWGTRTGAPALRIGPADFRSWRFSADGFSIATCSSEGDARSWDLSDGAGSEGTHRCPLVEPPLRVVPAGAAPEFLVAEPMAAELAAVPENQSRIAFPIGPGPSGADRVVVLPVR